MLVLLGRSQLQKLFLKGRASYVLIDVMDSKRQVCPTQPASYSHQLLLATPCTTVVE